MNTDIKDIGLVIWGCKGGYRIFCSNVVNVNEKDIADTLKDIRNYVYVQRHGIDYYAVEFTSRYKVYTHYRSSNDSGSGAFIAITLFVPHSLMIANIREVLDELVTKYFREYVNPLNGTPLPGKFDEIRPFQALLETSARVVPDRRMLRFSPSVQNNIPKLVKYDDLSTVDKYFENPYHSEFYECQEVMFFRRDLIDRRADYQISFSREPEIIEKISEPVPMNRLIAPEGSDAVITSLTINDVDCTASPTEQGVNPGDNLSITFSQEYFSPKTVSGTVDELMKQGVLARRGDDYRIVVPRMVPINYYLFIEAVGVDLATLFPHLRLANNVAGVIEAVDTEKGPAFVLQGPKVTAEYAVKLFPDRNVAAAFVIDSCRPLEMIRAGVSLHVEAKILNPVIKLPQGEHPEIDAEISSGGFMIKEPYAPGQKYITPPDAVISLRSPDGHFRVEGNVYNFIPAMCTYRVEFNPALNELLLDSSLTVNVDNKSYPVKGSEVKLPNPLTSSLLTLQVKGKKLNFSIPLASLGGNRLTVNATIICNRSSHPVTLSAGNGAVNVSPGEVKYGAPGVNVSFESQADANDLTLTHRGDDTLRVYTLKSITREGAEADTAKAAAKNPGKGEMVKVDFRNFKNYLVNGQRVADGHPIDFIKKEPVRISTLKNKTVATVTLTQGGGSNSKEFEVKGNGRDFTVTYRPTFISRAIDAVTSKTGIIVEAVIALAAIAAAVWYFGFRTSEQVYNLHLKSTERIIALRPLDTLSPIATPVDTVLRLSRTAPVTTITGNERVAVNYGAEGCDTLMLAEIVRGTEYSDLMTYLKSDKPAALTDRVIPLGPSPASRLYDEIKDNVNDSTVALFESRFSGSRHLAALKGALDAANQAEAEKEAAARAEAERTAAIAAQYLALVKKLNSMGCTKADVDAIDAFAQAHKAEIPEAIEAHRAKVNAYRKFFDRDQAISSLTRYFTKEQQDACKYYDAYWNIHHKNDPNRSFTYAARKAAEMGLK